MKWVFSAIAFSALLATAANAVDDKPLPSYFSPVVAEGRSEIEACYVAILVRDGLDSRTCNGTWWWIYYTQKKAKAATLDYADKAGFRDTVTKLMHARHKEIVETQSLPRTQAVIDNIGTAVGIARSELKDDRVSHCLADIIYYNDPLSLYCDFALADINLALYGLTHTPPIKLQREDLAAVLGQALPLK